MNVEETMNHSCKNNKDCSQLRVSHNHHEHGSTIGKNEEPSLEREETRLGAKRATFCYITSDLSL